MLKREDYIKQIAYILARLQTEIKLRGYINLYDIHVISEDFMSSLLNIVFNYQLSNLNYIHKNQAGIDLGDLTNGIAFQITAERSKTKIQKTIDEFIEKSLYEQYPQLYFFVLQEKYEPNSNFNTSGHFTFNRKQHILDFGDLIKEISALETGKLKEISEFLDREISTPDKSSSTDLSLLKRLLDELPAIKGFNYYHPDFQKWHNTIKLSLRQSFGENSYQVKEYDKIAWHTSDAPKHVDEQQNLFINSCIAAEGQLRAAIAVNKTPITDATVEFSYKFITVDYHLDEHLYQLVVAIENQGTQIINDLKLDFSFPDLSLVPRKWIVHTHQEFDNKPLTEVTPNSAAVSITRQGYIIQVTYRSRNGLFPNERLDLTQAIDLRYRINRSIFSNLADMPPLQWSLYADNMLRKQGNVTIAKLNHY